MHLPLRQDVNLAKYRNFSKNPAILAVVPEARLKGWPQADTLLLAATAVPAIVIVPKIEAFGAGKVIVPCGSGLGNTAITVVPI